MKRTRDRRESAAAPPQTAYANDLSLLFLTKGQGDDRVCLRNGSKASVAITKDQTVDVHAVDRDLVTARRRSGYFLKDLTLPGSSGSCDLSLSRDVHFEEVSWDSLASDVDLASMCMSKGIKCATFLSQHIHREQDPELELGALMRALFLETVREQLRRKYDIMHHYPLFNRAITMHYSSSDPQPSTPPTVYDMIGPDGLLDKSAHEHQRIHGVQLIGDDHRTFSHWVYPRRIDVERDDDSCQREPQREDNDAAVDSTDQCERTDTTGDDAPTSDAADETVAHEEEEDCETVAHEEDRDRQPGREIGPDTSSTWTDCWSAIQTFNNHPRTLTDRHLSFPVSYTIHVGKGVSFDDLISYCTSNSNNGESEALVGLPPRKQWGAVNPVLLMEDKASGDPSAGRNARSYTVTSRGYLSLRRATGPGSEPRYYNEVFLPGRPVSRLNLDVDLKCCQRCTRRFAESADARTKRSVAKAVGASLTFVIVEATTELAGVTREQIAEIGLSTMMQSVGKIAMYIRTPAGKSKLSFRMLWHLPVELCSLTGIEAYKPLLDAMERQSVRYALLSFPKDSAACGLCQLGESIGETSAEVKRLRIDGRVTELNRRSAIDKAPYSYRKCVRLPNCYKDGTMFEYVDTINAPKDLGRGSDDSPLALSVGLSSNPISVDVTSLGPMFAGILLPPLRDRQRSRVSPIELDSLQPLPDESRATAEAKRLMDLWGVPVTVRKTGSGLVCVQASERSDSYPCPKHKRVHSTCKLTALVFGTHTAFKCFVDG